jgi:hypothetical protein
MIPRRRMLLGLMVTAVAPVAVLNACKSDDGKAPPPRKIDFAADMTALLIAIGPWPPDDMAMTSFIERYLASHGAQFQDRGGVLNTLVTKLPSGGQQLAEIPLDVLTEAERTLLTAVVKDVHSIAELRWYLVGITAPGSCLGPA